MEWEGEGKEKEEEKDEEGEELKGGREMELWIALEEVTLDWIAPNIWLEAFCCNLLSDEIEDFTSLGRNLRFMSCFCCS